jgi:hypothetical protein
LIGDVEKFLGRAETDEERRQTLLDSFLCKEESKDVKIKMEDLLKFEEDFCFDNVGVVATGSSTLKSESNSSFRHGSTPPTSSVKRKFKPELDECEIKFKPKAPRRESPCPPDSENWSCLVCTLYVLFSLFLYDI